MALYSANIGAILVCAKNLKDKQNKRKQKRIKTEKEKKKKAKWLGAGITWGGGPSAGPANFAPRTAHLARDVAPLLLLIAMAAVEHTEVLDGDQPCDGCHRDAAEPSRAQVLPRASGGGR